jgi:hypothetical protein
MIKWYHKWALKFMILTNRKWEQREIKYSLFLLFFLNHGPSSEPGGGGNDLSGYFHQLPP